jgi:peptidoglycan/LPS O-acetylase OafA/YrhL
MSNDKAARRHDLDWLRALAMLNIFLFHSARLFNHEDWHVKNERLAPTPGSA